MPLALVTPPAVEPLEEGEVETHLRLEPGGDDSLYVSALSTMAREYVERITDRALITQTWSLVIDAFPAGRDPIVLAKGKLQSVTSVTYYDAGGTLQTLATSEYEVDTASEPGRVVLAPGKSWPATQTDKIGAVTVRFVAGYGDESSDVPAPIRQAILMLAAHGYLNREPEIVAGTVSQFSMGINALLSPYRLIWVG